MAPDARGSRGPGTPRSGAGAATDEPTAPERGFRPAHVAAAQFRAGYAGTRTRSWLQTPNTMSIEAVVFDWGGTLSHYADIELIDMWHLAAGHLARETGRDADELRDRLLAAELRYWDEVKRTQRTGTLHDILEAESRALGLDVTTAVISELAQRHLDAWTPHIRHHANAGEALRQLRAQGLRIGLLSNTHWPAAFHEHFLERDSLAPLIDVREYTSNLRYSKPHREAFEHVLRRLDVAPERAVMVGDRPIDDVWGAQQIGMRGIWRPHAASPELGDVKPDAVIEQLTELPAIVANW